MGIEPQNVRQQFGQPVKPVLNENSQAEYLEKLKAKFGKNALQRLHKIENAALKSNWDRLPGESTSSGVDATRARRKDWAAAVTAASPVTRHVAAALWDVFPPAADSRLQSLEAGGFAVRVPGAKPIHWQIIPEGGA